MSKGQSASNELTPLGPPKIEIIFFKGGLLGVLGSGEGACVGLQEERTLW